MWSRVGGVAISKFDRQCFWTVTTCTSLDFQIGWWLWGLSYLFPLNGTCDINPTTYGMVATAVCFGVSYVASVPMSEAVMNRVPDKKKMLSLAFLVGWIILGVTSALDVITQLDGMDFFIFEQRI